MAIVTVGVLVLAGVFEMDSDMAGLLPWWEFMLLRPIHRSTHLLIILSHLQRNHIRNSCHNVISIYRRTI